MADTTMQEADITDAWVERLREKAQRWTEKAESPEPITLEEMVQDVRQGMHELSGEILQDLVDLVDATEPDGSISCPQCGKRLTARRDQDKWVRTLLGTIRPVRDYFYCHRCRESYIPLDEQLDLGTNSLGGGLEETICLQAVRMPFEEVSAMLEHSHLIEVDDNTIERTVLRVGSDLVAHKEQDVERVWQAAEPPAMAGAEAPQRRYISTDGTHVHLQAGWKEAKVAAIYETETVRQPDGTAKVRAVDITYVVSFDEAATFAQHVYVEAARRGLHQAEEVIVLGDGAEWIWNHIADVCDDPVEILDFYHASQHVWAAGQALYGEDTPETDRWVEQCLDDLLTDGPDALLSRLWRAADEASGAAREAVIDEINYFTKRKHRMLYPELRAAGYHIGSGSVESACQRILGARLKQSGMIWSREGAQAMAQLRATVLSGRWDEYWAAYDRSTRTFLRTA
jgi:hypothetical protein